MLHNYITQHLWQQRNFINYLLLPISWLFQLITYLRRTLYQNNILSRTHFSVPIIVVGNLTVGGNGKTPCVMALAALLKEKGWKPGIVSRGYGGQARQYPLQVDYASDPKQAGDEAVLLARVTACPMVVDPNRVRAVKTLLANNDCNIVLSDDGLQHYALTRDIEIIVTAGETRFGNGYCLPAGPLREPITRLSDVDFVTRIDLKPQALRNLYNPEKRMSLENLPTNKIHAVAGIGNPQRFFQLLKEYGFALQQHIFPDHHPFVSEDLQAVSGATVIMTAKDAIKCESFAQPTHWYLPVEAQLSWEFKRDFLEQLRQLTQ